MDSVRLIENFRSFQGEGPDMGRAMLILRFKTCNLKCHWCDTSVKMRISAEAPHLLSDIQKTVNDTNCGLLITGGEPTIPKHYDEIRALLNELEYPIANVESNGFQLERLIAETNGEKNIKFIYSPKIFSEKDYEGAVKMSESLLKFDSVYFKVVYEERGLILSYLEKLSSLITGKNSLIEDRFKSRRVWLMPEGTNRSTLIKNSGEVFDAAERYKFNFSSRSHIIYGFV